MRRTAHEVPTLCLSLIIPNQIPHPSVDCFWNVMVHTQKPDFVFRRNGRVHLNPCGESVQTTIGSRGVHIRGSNGSNVGKTMLWGSVTNTDYPLQLPLSPSLRLPCVTVCHHISTGLYFIYFVRLEWFWILSLFLRFHFKGSQLNQKAAVIDNTSLV